MINYETILKITNAFYDIARGDILIGYHFRVIEDFDEHIPRIADFWNLQLNGSIRFKKNLPYEVLAVHKKLKVKRGEVNRWVKLFSENLDIFEADGSITAEIKEQWLAKVDIFKVKLI